MAKRKSKKPQQEDTSILLDSSVPQSKRWINSSVFSPALLFIIIFTVGASLMGWFCVQQQYSIDQMSESFTTMQKRISNLQQVMMTDSQSDAGFGVEDRIFALEEAQKQAEEKAKVALATSEKLKNSGVYSQLLALHNEMDIRLAEMKQVSVSVTTLQAMFKNQSEQFEAMKRSITAGLSSSLALAQNVAGLTNAVASASSRADKQAALVESLNVQLEGQASELDEMKESMELHSAALYTNNQEISAIKELVETKQTMRAQALEEMLSSVQMTLDEQFFTSQTLHSSVMARLQTFYNQLANAPSWSQKLKSNESPAEEELISTTAQNTSEVQEKQEDEEEAEDVAEDEAEEEAEEEEVMQPLGQEEEEEDVTEEQDEEDITEEEEDETTEEEEETAEEEEEEDETTEEEEEEEMIEDDEDEDEDEDEEIIEDEEETTEDEEEITDDEEETTDEDEEIIDDEEEEEAEETDDILDESLEEEEVFDEDEESWETEEEESAELNYDDFMDENEGDE